MGKDEKSLRKIPSCSILGKREFRLEEFEGLSNAKVNVALRMVSQSGGVNVPPV
jgi:hypothetical protein